MAMANCRTAPLESWGKTQTSGDVLHRQVEHLVDGLIGRKDAVIARDLAQGHIDGLNGVGGVDHLANILWEGKERDHARPL